MHDILEFHRYQDLIAYANQTDRSCITHIVGKDPRYSISCKQSPFSSTKSYVLKLKSVEDKDQALWDCQLRQHKVSSNIIKLNIISKSCAVQLFITYMQVIFPIFPPFLSCLLHSLCHVRSLTFKFQNYTMGNKYNNPLNTRNYRLCVPREINFVSLSLKLVTDNINFTRYRVGLTIFIKDLISVAWVVSVIMWYH